MLSYLVAPMQLLRCSGNCCDNLPWLASRFNPPRQRRGVPRHTLSSRFSRRRHQANVVSPSLVGQEPEDTYPIREETHITDHLALVAVGFCCDFHKLCDLPGMCGDDQTGLQHAWALLPRQVPSRILHFLHVHPCAHITSGSCGQIQAELQATIHCMSNCSQRMWQKMIIGLQKLRKNTLNCLGGWLPSVDPPRPKRLGISTTPQQGNILSAHPKRSCTFTLLSVAMNFVPPSDRFFLPLWGLRGHGCQGQSSWLRCPSRGSSAALPDCVFQWGLQQHLGCDAALAGARARGQGAAPDLTHVLSILLAATGDRLRKTRSLRDLLAQSSHQAGMPRSLTLQELFVPSTELTYRSSSLMAVSAGWMSKWHPLSVRNQSSIRNAKAKLFEMLTIWSRTSGAQYSSWMHDSFRCWSSWAFAPHRWRADLLSHHSPGESDRGAALRQVSGQFWEPVSCHLLSAGWHGIVHCAPGLELAVCQTRRPLAMADCQADFFVWPPSR